MKLYSYQQKDVNFFPIYYLLLQAKQNILLGQIVINHQ
jgi:hypothetical protein